MGGETINDMSSSAGQHNAAAGRPESTSYGRRSRRVCHARLLKPFALLVLLICSRSTAHGDPIAIYKAEIGYYRLEARLATVGKSPPTGAGVRVMQVEAPLPVNKYLPDNVTPGAELVGKRIQPASGVGGYSSHATTVGRSFYGDDSSIAPGIRLVEAYRTTDFLTSGCLRVLGSGAPLQPLRPPKVQNHSWVSYGLATREDLTATDISIDVIRRLDLLVARDGVIPVVGVANARALPPLLAGAYNAIAVGTSDAASSVGPTTVDTPGRSKPDIVAPGKFPFGSNTTSNATPRVSAAVALLIEAGSTLSSAADAVRPEVVKAVLLAGATKDDFVSWSQDDARPLDPRYGAGLLNVDNSHRILTAGKHPAGGTGLEAATGWDFGPVTPDAPRTYVIQADSPIKTLSIVACWLRRMKITDTGRDGPANLEPALANVDVRLHAADGGSAGLLLAKSLSPIDNVEHIYQTDLPAGRYLISVSSDRDWEVGLAWDTRSSPKNNFVGWLGWVAGIGAILVFRRRRRRG